MAHVSHADKAKRDKLRALPNSERQAEYWRLKRLQKNHERLTNGQFLFVRDHDQHEIARKRLVYHARARLYAGNKVSGGGFSNLHRQ